MPWETVKKLSETGFKLNDLVLYSSDKNSTGGVIYQIVEDTEPVVPASKSRPGERLSRVYNAEKGGYETQRVQTILYGQWDAKGKKISVAAVHGYVRIKPLFEFFATRKGKDPKGKGKTLIIYYRDIKHSLEKVDLVVLGTKYLELGNIMRDIARNSGMLDGE